MARMDELMESAAQRFDDGSSPFCTEWLAEHKVTLDECDNLSKSIANACKNWARLDQQGLLEAVVRATVEDAGERDMMLGYLRRKGAMTQTIDELSKLSKRIGAKR